MTVKELRLLLLQYDENNTVCIEDSMSNFYEPLRSVAGKKARAHCDVYSDNPKRFVEEYRQDFVQQIKVDLVVLSKHKARR